MDWKNPRNYLIFPDNEFKHAGEQTGHFRFFKRHPHYYIVIIAISLNSKTVILMVIEHVNGKKIGKIMLYALSTCGWCNRTKELLRSLGVEFDYVYVDLLMDNEQEAAIREVEKWNPKGSFPTLVIRDERTVVGFQEKEIREALGL
jgi:glutaredoxin-like protein NrdH